MTIKSIAIENVKGIANQTFDLEILPNKPSILVAPNGFGKSSFAAAFSCLNSARMVLPKEHHHKGDEHRQPRLTLTITKDGVDEVLSATSTSNLISANYDIHVISNRLAAKAVKRNMGSFTTASASITIDPFVLSTVPPRSNFPYSSAQMKANFGANGKILKNIDALLSNSIFAEKLISFYTDMDKFSGVRIQRNINQIVEQLNAQNGTSEQIKAWATANLQATFEEIDCIRAVADLASRFDLTQRDRIDALLSAYQICVAYTQDKQGFKNACKYKAYINEKNSYEEIIGSFDTTWKSIRPAESGGKLIVDFPAASNISNGQRDSLCFAAWLRKVSNSVGQRDCILVIDEVFDYLDDANLIAVQYYISNLIGELKGKGSKIYPLILTHLNPIHFRNFTFKDQKIYFLKKSKPVLNEHFKKLIVNRSDNSISPTVDRHHLHFHPTAINLRTEFRALSLKETWGESAVFHAHTESEWNKYIAGDDNYDPFAVCCYVRVKIEQLAYEKIVNDDDKVKFLETNGTTAKLELAEEAGVDIKNTAFFLGVIYNEGMHIKEHVDNSSPIVYKLENLTIRKMLIESTG